MVKEMGFDWFKGKKFERCEICGSANIRVSYTPFKKQGKWLKYPKPNKEGRYHFTIYCENCFLNTQECYLETPKDIEKVKSYWNKRQKTIKNLIEKKLLKG